MESCRNFRAQLGAALEGCLDDAPQRWHEHIFACADCRALFEAEEALEVLLACLPEPQLPVALAQRVLRRLAAERTLEHNLDQAIARALQLDGAGAAPANLAQRVLQGLEAHQSSALDRLLAQLPEPTVPAGLAGRVLSGLAPPAPLPRLQLPNGRRAAGVAALLLALLGGYRLLGPEDGRPGETERVASHESATPVPAEVEVPDPELLAAFDLLEDWDLLMPSDPDLLLGSLDESETELLLLDVLTEAAVVDEEESEG